MGRILEIRHPDITGQPKTTLTASVSASDTSLTVTNSSSFTTAKYELIGGLKSPTAEIKLAGTISSDTAIPIAALDFDHPAGTTVTQIPYNQVEIDYSTNLQTLWESGLYETLQDASDAATWANLVTTAITPDQDVTTYKDDSTASRSYRWRYKNSTDTVYSDYITIILPDGFDEKQVSAIFRKATGITNKEISDVDGAQINTQFLMDTINEGIRAVTQKRKRWSHDQAFEVVVDEMTAGVNQYALPFSIEVRESNRSLWNLRIEDGSNLAYLDKREMDLKHNGWHHSQLAAQLTSGSSTATFDDTSNFGDTGTFTLWTGTTKDEVRYTANNRTTNVLTLTDASTDVTTTHAVDTDVWEGASYGKPYYWSVRDGYIVFDVIPNSTMHLRNIDADYYHKPQKVTSEDEYIRIGDPNVLVHYLRWGISKKSNNDTNAREYYQMFTEALMDLKNIETTGQRQKLVPRGWRYNSWYRNRYQRLK